MASHDGANIRGAINRTDGWEVRWGILISKQTFSCQLLIGKRKAIPVQVWREPERSRRLRSPYFMTIST
jgi:hypothetical protein